MNEELMHKVLEALGCVIYTDLNDIFKADLRFEEWLSADSYGIYVVVKPNEQQPDFESDVYYYDHNFIERLEQEIENTCSIWVQEEEWLERVDWEQLAEAAEIFEEEE